MREVIYVGGEEKQAYQSEALDTAVRRVGDVDVVDAILADCPKTDVSKLLCYALEVKQYDVAASLYKFQNRHLDVPQPSDLLQGPSQKNRAHRDIEYIMHCMLGVRFISVPSDGDRYAPLPGQDSEAKFSVDTQKHLLATCSNGVTYNVSLALKYANLYYFILDFVERRDLLLAFQKRLHHISDESELGEVSAIGRRDAPLYVHKVEQEAVYHYTGVFFKGMNALLRGEALVETNVAVLEVRLCQVLLSVSMVNKLSDLSARDLTLVRYEGEVPAPVSLAMDAGDLVRRSGMNSFSSQPDGVAEFSGHRSKIVLRGSLFGSIARFSRLPQEGEHLLPPGCMQTVDKVFQGGKLVYGARLIYGVMADNADEYMVDQALYQVAIVVSYAYADTPDALFGVNRHNHALSHHVRVVSYVDAVVQYFAKHAADPLFQQYCKGLVAEERNIIKVLLAFSKVGRESEIAFFDDPGLYQQYQNASVAHLIVFLKEACNFDDERCRFYAEILRYMGNPDFTEIATGNAQQKQEKIWINHIITLAHKLDLLRCYGKGSYQRSLHVYGDVCGSSADQTVVDLSDSQSIDLTNLKKQVWLALKLTGDRVMFSDMDMPIIEYDEAVFARSNGDVSYCKERCAQAALMMKVLEQKKSDVNAIFQKMQTIPGRECLQQLALLPKNTLVNQMKRRDFWVALSCQETLGMIFEAVSYLVCEQPDYPYDPGELFVYKAIQRGDWDSILKIISLVGVENMLMQRTWRTNVFQLLYFEAVKGGDVDLCKELEKYPIDVDADDNSFNSVMHLAIIYSQNDILLHLLELDEIDINHKDVLSRSPLMRALVEEQRWMASKILSHPKVDVDRQDAYGCTPLMAVISSDIDDDMFDTIVSHRTFKINTQGNDGLTALHYAVYNKRHAFVDRLLAQPGIDLTLTHSEGYTVFMYAVASGDVDVVRKFLPLVGSTINKQSVLGETALIQALKNCNPDIINMVMRHPSVDVDIADNEGHMPLYYAIRMNGVNAVRYLCGKVSDVNARFGTADDAHTALTLAVSMKHYAVVNVLLSMTAVDVNVMRKGLSPLMVAVQSGNIVMVKALLARPDVNVDLTDLVGRNALHLAVIEGSVEIVNLLLPLSSSAVNAKMKYGNTPLMIAAMLSRVEIARALLHHEDIDLKVRNDEGRTADDVARGRIRGKITEDMLIDVDRAPSPPSCR